MDILNQSVGFFDKETGTNVVLVPGTVIPRGLEKDEPAFVDFLESEKLLERAPRGFKPNAQQSYFYLKEDAVDAGDSTEEETEVQPPETPEEVTAETAEDTTPETTEDDADPDLFAVGAEALKEATVEEVEAMAATMSAAELDDLLALEQAGKNRKGVKQAIAKRRKELSE